MRLRTVLAVATAYVSVFALTGNVIAAEKGPKDKGAPGKQAHKHHHMNGHNALGAKLKQNGKHEVGKVGNHTVTAEVNNGKVTNMSAEGTMVRKVKSHQKMAGRDPESLLAAARSPLQFVQDSGTYYGYCFDDGYDYTCYWYPEEDVDTSGSWDDYDPYY